MILGPSGSGKTTLISILAGLLQPSSGSIHCDGQDLGTLSPSDYDEFRGQNIGFVFQTLHLIPFLTVRQNLMLACSLPDKAVSQDSAMKVLSRLGLADLMESKADRLSTGEKQRLAVGRAIIGSPKWIFCDEPTSALDDTNASAMLDLLKSEATQCGASLVIVTHDSRVKTAFEGEACLQLNAAGKGLQ